MGPKRRTDLKIWPSEAKNLKETDFDIKKHLAPPKSAEHDEKTISETEYFFVFFLASKDRKLQIVRNARCRSFAPIGVKFEV